MFIRFSCLLNRLYLVLNNLKYLAKLLLNLRVKFVKIFPNLFSHLIKFAHLLFTIFLFFAVFEDLVVDTLDLSLDCKLDLFFNLLQRRLVLLLSWSKQLELVLVLGLHVLCLLLVTCFVLCQHMLQFGYCLLILNRLFSESIQKYSLFLRLQLQTKLYFRLLVQLAYNRLSRLSNQRLLRLDCHNLLPNILHLDHHLIIDCPLLFLNFLDDLLRHLLHVRSLLLY